MVRKLENFKIKLTAYIKFRFIADGYKFQI